MQNWPQQAPLQLQLWQATGAMQDQRAGGSVEAGPDMSMLQQSARISEALHPCSPSHAQSHRSSLQGSHLGWEAAPDPTGTPRMVQASRARTPIMSQNCTRGLSAPGTRAPAAAEAAW